MELSRQSVLQLVTALLLLSHQSEGQCSSTNNLTANSFEKRFAYTSPSRFRNNITCSWLIRTTGDKSLNMKVMVNIMRSENCKDGYLDLYEGLGNNGNLISRVCGTRNIRLSGHGRYIYVYLHSSSFGPGSYLNLTYRSVDRVLLKTKVYTLTSEEAITKQLTSPYYPEVYLNKMKYLYIIMASDKNYFVRLHVSELITWCPHDMLSIYDGASETGRKTGSLCGNRKDVTKVSSGRKMLLVFQTDGSWVAKGFQASYTSYLKGFPEIIYVQHHIVN